MEHVCPECGRAFDRQWVVFGAGFLSKGARMTRIAMRVFAVLFALMQIAVTYVLTVYGRPREAVLALVLWLPALIVIRWFFVRSLSKVMLIVGPAGVRVYRGTEQKHHVDWTDVGKARFIGSRNAIVFGAVDQPISVSVKTLDLFGWDQTQIHPCLRAINESPWRAGESENVSAEGPAESD